MTEECFYCGEEASTADIDRMGKCPSCMATTMRAAEAAARDSATPTFTVGPHPMRMY